MAAKKSQPKALRKRRYRMNGRRVKPTRWNRRKKREVSSRRSRMIQVMKNIETMMNCSQEACSSLGRSEEEKDRSKVTQSPPGRSPRKLRGELQGSPQEYSQVKSQVRA